MTRHSWTRALSAWLLAAALLLAPGLTDVCSAWCASSTHAPVAVAVATPAHHSQGMGHEHCAKTGPAAASVSSLRASHGSSMPALAPGTHQCQLHARTGAPVADDFRTAARASASSSRSGLDALASPPAVIPLVFSVAPSSVVSDLSAQLARPASLPLQRPLRI